MEQFQFSVCSTRILRITRLDLHQILGIRMRHRTEIWPHATLDLRLYKSNNSRNKSIFKAFVSWFSKIHRSQSAMSRAIFSENFLKSYQSFCRKRVSRYGIFSEEKYLMNYAQLVNHRKYGCHVRSYANLFCAYLSRPHYSVKYSYIQVSIFVSLV